MATHEDANLLVQLARRARERLGADALYENFEALARAQAG